MSRVLIIVIICASINAQNLEKSRSVWVEQGLVRGRVYKLNDRFMQLFRGIPYAEPPVADLRFRRPVKRGRWHQELVALDYGAPCIQFMDFHRHDKFSGVNMARESEDCLFLNVFAPYDADDEAKRYPVLVWIHGGSFLAGSSDTGIDMEVIARNIIFKGCVLVTINYRLGPLGFINSRNADGTLVGNNGIWDQVMALEWIQANIKQFNGNPDQVTVIGESAGAAAASVLALSPVTEGMVHRAIVMSGSSAAGWAVHGHGASDWNIQNVGAYLSCKKHFNRNDLSEILRRPLNDVEMDQHDDDDRTVPCNLQDSVPSCLRDDPMSDEDMFECFRKELNFSSFIFRKALTVELGVSKMVVDGELLPMPIEQLMRTKAHVPLMTGVARREWAHKKPMFYSFRGYTSKLSRPETEEKVRAIIESAYHKGNSVRLPNATLDLIGNATYFRYMTHRNDTWQLEEFVRQLQDLEADIEFVAPCQLEIDAYALAGQPVFAYSFDYTPTSPMVEDEHKPFNLFGEMHSVRYTRKEKYSDAFHGLDHAFVFTRGYSSNFQIRPFTKRDRKMSQLLSSMITNFARDGNPTPRAWNGFFDWLPYTNDSRQHARLDIPPRIESGEVHWPTPTFWNSHVRRLTRYTNRVDGEYEMSEDDDRAALNAEERLQLDAYKRAWYTLWLLVGTLAVVIWIVVLCLVVRKCRSPRSKPYDNIVVSSSR